jgi:hypothetical protein
VALVDFFNISSCVTSKLINPNTNPAHMAEIIVSTTHPAIATPFGIRNADSAVDDDEVVRRR